MDHLIYNNINFNKTKMAIRATFITVHSNKQIAVLVPTTLLTQQHYNNFRTTPYNNSSPLLS